MKRLSLLCLIGLACLAAATPATAAPAASPSTAAATQPAEPAAAASAAPAASQPAAAATQPAGPATAAPAPFAMPPGMTTYYFVLLRRGAAWSPEETPERARLLAGHLANIRRLAAAGQLVLAGPFIDSGPQGLAGIFILRAGSVDEARKLLDTDPAIQAGRLAPEILRWMGPTSLASLRDAMPKP